MVRVLSDLSRCVLEEERPSASTCVTVLHGGRGQPKFYILREYLQNLIVMHLPILFIAKLPGDCQRTGVWQMREYDLSVMGCR